MPFARGVTAVAVAEHCSRDFDASYADAFRLDVLTASPAREWARLSLPSGSRTDRLFASLIWGRLLGFRLLPLDQPGTLAGWSLNVDDLRTCILDNDGRLMAGRMIFEVGAGPVTWTTMIRFHSSRASRIWSAAGHLHRQLAPIALSSAALRTS